jgi:hypothetical protein
MILVGHKNDVVHCRVFNPFSSNVKCSQELADYPLLGRALPEHQPAAAASSSSSSGVGDGVSSSLCIVDLVNTIQPGILPAADNNAAWKDIINGKFADTDITTSRYERLLLGATDLGLKVAQKTGFVWALRKATALLPLPKELELCQPPLTIDAESTRLEPLADAILGKAHISSEVLIKDR